MKPARTRRTRSSPRQVGRALWTGLLLLVVGLVSTFSPASASAHTSVLGGSTPSADEVVRTAGVIELRFTGPVRTEGAVFTLRALSGEAPTLAAPKFADDKTSVTFKPDAPLPEDRYRVGYQLVAFDGHPASGVFEFELSRDGEVHAPAWPTEETAPPVTPQPQAVEADRNRPWILAATAAVIVLLTMALLRLDHPTRQRR